jgi:hypothetical protein
MWRFHNTIARSRRRQHELLLLLLQQTPLLLVVIIVLAATAVQLSEATSRYEEAAGYLGNRFCRDSCSNKVTATGIYIFIYILYIDRYLYS